MKMSRVTKTRMKVKVSSFNYCESEIPLLTCIIAMPDKEGIEDKTGTNLVNLRRTIYLTIMNTLTLTSKKLFTSCSNWAAGGLEG